MPRAADASRRKRGQVAIWPRSARLTSDLSRPIRRASSAWETPIASRMRRSRVVVSAAITALSVPHGGRGEQDSYVAPFSRACERSEAG